MTAATKASLSSLAHRVQSLDRELAELDEKIDSLLLATAPDLMALFGVGPDTAASLLVAAGDNPERLHPKPPGPICAERPRSRPTPGRAPVTSDGTRVVTARPTARSGASPWSGSPTTPRPPTTSTAE